MPVIPLHDHGTIEDWFAHFSTSPHCVWLDGVDGARGADWSILAADPVEQRSGPEEDLLSWLNEWEARLRPLASTSVPFAGGLIGQLNYREEMPPYPPPQRPRLAGWLGLYDRALVWHRPSRQLYAVVGPWIRGGEDELRRWVRDLSRMENPATRPIGIRSTKPVSNFSRADYMEGVRKVREWIASGDIYQANLSQRFSCHVEGSAAQLYRALRRENPAPYSAFLDCGSRQILSSSPELFLAVDSSRRVSTRPIKGTRPRSADPMLDQNLASALQANEKERAELLMIVDMERSDLGRVCEVGSVSADRKFALESFAAVHHLVGEVSGQLREGVTIADLIAATFPGGSITGAPKVRAMEIIRHIEPAARRAYCGTIGFISVAGVARWNIAIRTMEKAGSRVDFGVGAGLVWDSIPEAEYEETLHKARRMFSTLGWAVDS